LQDAKKAAKKDVKQQLKALSLAKAAHRCAQPALRARVGGRQCTAPLLACHSCTAPRISVASVCPHSA
jgi:hypothetical protein